MTRNIRLLISAVFLVIAPLFMVAQPPHPNGGNPPGPGNAPLGATASIGDGLFILATLATAYASRKLYMMHKSTETEKA